MNVDLQEWFNDNNPSDDMIYKNQMIKQFLFVRDTVPLCLIPDNIEYEERFELFKTICDNIKVISTHTSKSILLPVYRIKAFNNVYIMRNNFYDWKVSVETPDVHDIDFIGLGVSSGPVGRYCCEGFKDEWIYTDYEENPSKYTIEIGNDFKLRLFFWLIKNKEKLGEKMKIKK